MTGALRLPTSEWPRESVHSPCAHCATPIHNVSYVHKHAASVSLFIFVAVSYFVWARASGYYRYAIPLELLTGVVTIGALIWLIENRRVRLVVAFTVLAVAATTTVYPDWGRRPYGDRYVDIHVPPLPPNSVVLIATGSRSRISFLLPSRKLNMWASKTIISGMSQDNKLASKVKR